MSGPDEGTVTAQRRVVAKVRSDEAPGRLRKVALFLADLGGGGAERMMVRLAAGFAERGVEVDLVLANAVGPYLEEVPPAVRVVDLARASTTAAVLPLARYLRRDRPDVLLATLHHASFAAALAHRLSGGTARLIVREANTPSGKRVAAGDLKRRAVMLGIRWAYGSADAVIAVSEGVADDLREHRGVPASKIKTLYNPVVTADVAAQAAIDPRHPWLQPDAPPVVLGVGSLQPRKGFFTLLDAFARLRSRMDARLIVLGEGPQRAELEARARALDISDHVEFPGFLVNPFAYMARASVFVLSSEREGLPGVLIQAMACGCPVVATDCPSGPREILEGGRHGALVPVGDAAAMAEAIERTIVDPVDKGALVERAGRFSGDRVISAHLDAFERALADAGRAGRTS